MRFNMAETREARPTTGTLKSRSGFGRGAFGFAVFGEVSGYENVRVGKNAASETAEARSTNSETREGLTAA